MWPAQEHGANRQYWRCSTTPSNTIDVGVVSLCVQQYNRDRLCWRCATPGSALRPSICRTWASASTGWKRHARARREAPVSDFPLRAASPSLMVVGSPWLASLTREQPLPLSYLWRTELRLITKVIHSFWVNCRARFIAATADLSACSRQSPAR